MFDKCRAASIGRTSKLGMSPTVCGSRADAELWIAALFFLHSRPVGYRSPPAAAVRHRLPLLCPASAVLVGVNALCATIGKGSVAAGTIGGHVTLDRGRVSAISFVAFADLVAAGRLSGTRPSPHSFLTEVGVGRLLTAAVAPLRTPTNTH